MPSHRTAGTAVLPLGPPQIMGILNVTPDSFSDGGTHDASDEAVAHAQRMIAEGADIIDVGGESTRPGAQRISAEEQKRRVVEVVRRICELPGRDGKPAVVGIDTTLTAVAEAALDAGAAMLNDMSAGREDPRMLSLAAERGVPICLMHMRGAPATMQQNPVYTDVVAEVEAFLLERARVAVAAGVKREQILIDPGIGFGKTKAHNLALLAALPRFVASGYPVLLGTSRKRFMGSIVQGDRPGEPPTPSDLIGATCATTALGVAAGVAVFRVHDVKPNRQAADVAWAIAAATERGNSKHETRNSNETRSSKPQ